MDLYQELTKAGVPTDSHESDLYFQDNPISRQILERYEFKQNVRRFTYQARPHKGEAWFDAPFAFTPYWTNKTKHHEHQPTQPKN